MNQDEQILRLRQLVTELAESATVNALVTVALIKYLKNNAAIDRNKFQEILNGFFEQAKFEIDELRKEGTLQQMFQTSGDISIYDEQIHQLSRVIFNYLYNSIPGP